MAVLGDPFVFTHQSHQGFNFEYAGTCMCIAFFNFTWRILVALFNLTAEGFIIWSTCTRDLRVTTLDREGYTSNLLPRDQGEELANFTVHVVTFHSIFHLWRSTDQRRDTNPVCSLQRCRCIHWSTVVLVQYLPWFSWPSSDNHIAFLYSSIDTGHQEPHLTSLLLHFTPHTKYNHCWHRKQPPNCQSECVFITTHSLFSVSNVRRWEKSLPYCEDNYLAPENTG